MPAMPRGSESRGIADAERGNNREDPACGGRFRLHGACRRFPGETLRLVSKGLAATQAASILGSDAIDDYYREESRAALARAEKILRAAGVAYTARYEVGEIADRICAYAGEHAMDLIVMGSHGHGAFANLVMGSVATKVLAAKSRVPVLIVR